MNVVSIIGKRFGSLSVIDRAPTKITKTGNYITMWLCVCDCGTRKQISGSNLRGRVLTCGLAECRFHAGLLEKRSNKNAATAGYRQVYSWYKIKSKKAGRDFSLTLDEVTKIASSDCYYCGCPPSNNARHDSRFGKLKYSGIDRRDNTRGYVAENCVACCAICNSMKMCQTEQQFMAQMRRILEYRQPS